MGLSWCGHPSRCSSRTCWTGWRRRAGILALVVSLLTHHGAFDELFGKRASLMLQSYGVFLFGGLVLFVVASAVLGNLRKTGFPVPPRPETA